MLEGEDVHSSIITKVEGDVILYLTAATKKVRAQICVQGNEFHLPVTSVTINEMFKKAEGGRLTFNQGDVDFVCVSLARPFLPWLSSHLDKPRCYAMLSGIVLSTKKTL